VDHSLLTAVIIAHISGERSASLDPVTENDGLTVRDYTATFKCNMKSHLLTHDFVQVYLKF